MKSLMALRVSLFICILVRGTLAFCSVSPEYAPQYMVIGPVGGGASMSDGTFYCGSETVSISWGDSSQNGEGSWYAGSGGGGAAYWHHRKRTGFRVEILDSAGAVVMANGVPNGTYSMTLSLQGLLHNTRYTLRLGSTFQEYIDARSPSEPAGASWGNDLYRYSSPMGLFIDTQGPAVEANLEPSGWTQVDKPTLNYRFRDSGSGLASAVLIEAGQTIDDGAGLDLGASDLYSSYRFRNALSEGEHSITLRVADKAGNSTQPPEAFRIAVDKTPPSILAVSSSIGVAATQPVLRFVTAASPVFTVSATDGKGSGIPDGEGARPYSIVYPLGGGSWGTLSGTNALTFNPVASGDYELHFQVEDRMGLKSALNGFVAMQKALVEPPSIAVNDATDDGWYGISWFAAHPDGLTVAVADDLGGAVSRAEYRTVDGGTWTTLARIESTNDFRVPLVADGEYEDLEFHAVDEAGNEETLSQAARIDRTPPSLSLKLGGVPLGSVSPCYVDSRKALDLAMSDNVGLLSCSYTIDSDEESENPVPLSATSFSPTLDGRHEYGFRLEDRAGNAIEVAYPIVRNSSAPSLGAPLPAGGFSTVRYIDAGTGLASSLVPTREINADALVFHFEPIRSGGQAMWGGSYAPPETIAASLAPITSSTPLLSFSGSEATEYSARWAIPRGPSGVSDGVKTVYYKLIDKSGLSSSGSFQLILHRTRPGAISPANVHRDAAAGWSAPAASAPSLWRIGKGDALALESGARRDSVSIDGYVDANAAGATFTTYRYSIVDLSDPEAAFGADGKTYSFAWGAESERTITFTVTCESGLASDPISTVLVKPRWTGCTPSKVVDAEAKSFSLVWSDSSESAIAGAAKRIQWGPEYSSSLGMQDHRATLTALVCGAVAGGRLSYRLVVDEAGAASDDSTLLGAEIEGEQLSFSIPYESLPPFAMPEALSFLRAEGEVVADDLPRIADDGTPIYYSMTMSVLPSGLGRLTERILGDAADPEHPGDLVFGYRLRELFSDKEASLAALLGSSAIHLELTGGYDDPSVPARGKPSVSVESEASWDIEAPTIGYGGMMAQKGQVSSSALVSGIAADSGGSRLSRLRISWAPVALRVVDGLVERVTGSRTTQDLTIAQIDSLAFALDLAEKVPDGRYQIQVEAIDGAGNSRLETPIEKFIDTRSPALTRVAFAGGRGTQAGTGARYANPDGSLSIELGTDDSGGTGLAAVEYAWASSGGALSETTWQRVAIPGIAYADLEAEWAKTRSVQVVAPSGQSRLRLRLVDAAGNRSEEATDPGWLVSYDPDPPIIAALRTAGLRESGGSYFAKSVADISASLEGPQALPEAELRWNVVTLGEGGSVDAAEPQAWSSWGVGLGSLRSRIHTDGRRYQIRAMARNANGVACAAVCGAPFTLDRQGPLGVSAALGGASTFVAGEPIGLRASGSDPYSGIAWSWSRQRTDIPGAEVVSEAYDPCRDPIIALPGSYRIILSATSGSGICVSSAALSVTIVGKGLVVHDSRRFAESRGCAGGTWSYKGTTAAAGFRYRWMTEAGALVQGWLPGDGAMSSLLRLSDSLVALESGDVVRLEVEALDASGALVAQAKSLGCRIDDSPPAFAQWRVPSFVTPQDLWVEYEGADEESGIQEASLVVRRIGPEEGASAVVSERKLSPSSERMRIDIDLSDSDLATGDLALIEVCLCNGAGISVSKTSGIVLVDGTAPPVPSVMEPVEALRYRPSDTEPGSGYDRLSFQWTFSRPDPESGTVAYYWKAYASPEELEGSDWTEAPEGGATEVTGLDYSNSKYGGAGVYEDGATLRFAVMAVNGAGLSSVGYSRGLVLDSKAPRVLCVEALDLEKRPIQGYVAAESLRRGDASSAVIARVAASDVESGVSRIAVRAGSYDFERGFVAGAEIVFEPDAAAGAAAEGFCSPEIALSDAGPGMARMLRGGAYDAADNLRTLYSPLFKIVDSLPTLASVLGVIGPETLGFAWEVEDESDAIQDYLVALYKMDGTIGIPVLVDSRAATATKAKSATFSWKDLGLARGDRLECRVAIEFKGGLGISSERVASVVIAPDQPLLAAFDYSSYFSDHMNVKTLAYSAGDGVADGPAGIESIQWRLLDAATGSVFQDWSADRSGTAISVTKPFAALSVSPRDGDRLLIETRARSRMGVWSPIAPSRVLVVDASPPLGLAIARDSPYSNAPQGILPGWSIEAADPESGILAYQTILVAAAEAGDPAGLDWPALGELQLVSLPRGQILELSELGLGFGSRADGDYVAYLRVQNGTEDWSAPVMSGLVSIDRKSPTIRLVFADRVIRVGGSGPAAKITNYDSESIACCSSKELTSFFVSIDGVALGPGEQPRGIEGSYGQQGVKSYGLVTLSAAGTKRISVQGTDAFGNSATATDSIRFNEGPAIKVLRSTTTPAQVLELEKLVDVSDASGDYPLSYRWSLGGGIGVGYEDRSSYSGGPTASWGSAPYHRAMYLQSGKRQVTSYSVSLSVTDSWGKLATFPFEIEVRNTSSGTLYTDEYWSGGHELTGMVEVPSGLSLTLEGASVLAKGSLAGEILASGIEVRAGARLLASGGASSVSSGVEGFMWKGIFVRGSLEGPGLRIGGAERALVLEPGGTISLSGAALEGNLIGLHLLGGKLGLSSATVSGNVEYGVKEDAAGAYILTRGRFRSNGVDYYELRRSRIGMGELNGIGGNSDNARY